MHSLRHPRVCILQVRLAAAQDMAGPHDLVSSAFKPAISEIVCFYMYMCRCGGMHLVDAFIILGVCGVCILWMYDLVIQGYKYLQGVASNLKRLALPGIEGLALYSHTLKHVKKAQACSLTAAPVSGLPPG